MLATIASLRLILAENNIDAKITFERLGQLEIKVKESDISLDKIKNIMDMYIPIGVLVNYFWESSAVKFIKESEELQK